MRRLCGSRQPALRAALAILTAGLLAATPSMEAQAVVLASHAACQKAIAKAGRAYAVATLKTLRRCELRQLSGGDASACNDSKVSDALAKATGKFDSTITKACSTLTGEDLSAPRPVGLALEPLAPLLPSLRTAHDRLVQGLIDTLYAPATSGGATPSETSIDCQAALDRAVALHVTASFKLLGTACQLREDAGRSVTGEVSRIAEACLATMAPALDEAAGKASAKVPAACSNAAFTELGACPTETEDRTTDNVTHCLLDRARDVAAAAIAAEHGREAPRVIGRIEASVLGGTATVAASDAHVVLIDEDGLTISEADADATGRIDLRARPLERFTLCWDRDGSRSCSSDPVDVGLETVFFESRAIDVPLGAGDAAIAGKLLRADDSPCFEASTTADFALRGEVRVGPTGGTPGTERIGVSPTGDFVVAVPLAGSHSLHADCGSETVVVDLGATLDPVIPIDIHTTNVAPANGTVDILTSGGTPLTDPTTVNPGDTLLLHASFDDTDPLEYRWEITRGDGELHAPGLPADNPLRASGADIEWVVGGSSGIHQATLWASDGKGGIESVVETIGPINVDPVLPSPCLVIPKLQKILCGTGYTPAVPAPAGGLGDFLSYKYRNPSRNSAGDACLYYNLVDPECIDLDCDGNVDPGTDPLNKCNRTTLGGWWQKNGFDPVTGLGSDVVTAWYLNSNDLGFGREMHCRVTSWSSIIAERPAGSPTSASLLVESLRSQILASPQVAEWTELFDLYPSTVACYVANYTTDHCFNYPTNDPQNADLAYQGQQAFVANPSVNPPNAYGTVAMEFGPVEGFGELGAITKFFVYNGRTASGKRLTAANLDGCGPKSVPELCMSCHGGNWPGDWSHGTTVDNIVAGLALPGQVLAGIDANDTTPTDAGFLLRRGILEKLTREESGFSSFLPFDPDTYVFPSAASSAAQAAAIRKLNQLVLYAKPTTPISDLVKGWYGNNLASGTFAAWRPTAWNDTAAPGDESDLYDEVYAVACRGCHAAHYSFASPGNFPTSTRVCKNGSGLAGGTPTMPHAKLTYLNLWKGDYPQALTMPALETWYTAAELGFTSCD